MNSSALFWNVWGHRNSAEVAETLDCMRDVDVICLTEVTDVDEQQIFSRGINMTYFRNDDVAMQVDGRAQVEDVLSSSHRIRYETATRSTRRCRETSITFSSVGFGSIIAVRNDCDLITFGQNMLIVDETNKTARVFQWVVYEKQGIRFLVAHIHGVWIKDNTKGDSSIRDRQSCLIRQTIAHIVKEHLVDKVVLGGDFNLDIDTNAIEIIEWGEYEGDFRLVNLIREFGVINTRTATYRNYGKVGESMYADYVLVSEAVGIDGFVVDTKNTASDHAPLLVHFY